MVLKLLFQQFLNLSSSQRDMSGPILGALSNNRLSGGNTRGLSHFALLQLFVILPPFNQISDLIDDIIIRFPCYIVRSLREFFILGFE